jgi:hypothetical protein
LYKTCAGVKVVHSQAENVSKVEHHFASKSFAAVREAFSNAYPENEVPTGNNTLGHRMFLSVRSARRATEQLK